MSRFSARYPDIAFDDTVVREASALVQRYRLMRDLTDMNGIRRDLRGDHADPHLVDQMVRQLVAGVDAPYHRDDLTWPIRAGVRLETLAQSPWLDEIRPSLQLHDVPRTAADFAELFETRTGIAPDSYAMVRNFRITPLELGRVAEQIGGNAEKPSAALLFLCSRHYDAAVAATATTSVLTDIPASRNQFAEPAIEGFRLLGELERIGLVIEEMGAINLLGVSRIRNLLDGTNPSRLAKALTQRPMLKRLFDYQMIGTDALGGFDNAEAAGIILTDPNLRAAASAQGRVDVDVVKALTSGSVDGHDARVILRAAFPDREPDTRESFMANDDPAAFYGLNWTLAGALLADLGRRFAHGDPANATGGDHERQALLAGEMLAKRDPRQHARNTSRSAHLGAAQSIKSPSGTNQQRDAIAHGALMVPALSALGSSPRGRTDRWDDHRWDDQPLWTVMLDRKRGAAALDLASAERAQVDSAFARLAQLFQRTLANAVQLTARQDREDAIRAVCDMATAVSTISLNRFAGRAIIAWLNAFAGAHKGAPKQHGRRWTAGIAHIVQVRMRRGQPPVGDKTKGSPRRNRAITRKLIKSAEKIDAFSCKPPTD